MWYGSPLSDTTNEASISLTSKLSACKYLLLTEFEGCTVGYGPSFFPINLRLERAARGP